MQLRLRLDVDALDQTDVSPACTAQEGVLHPLHLQDSDSSFFTDFLTRQATEAIIRIASEHRILFAVLFDNRDCLAWAIVNTVTASLTLVNINRNDVHCS